MTVRAGREFLAIPGPTTVPDEVLRAMHRPAVDIYSGPLLALTDSLMRDMARMFNTKGRAYIYSANGHGAWEAALTNVLSRGDHILVLESGRFAVGWGNSAARMGVEVEILKGDMRRAVRPAEVEARLKADKGGSIKAMLVAQIDTGSGVVNDIGAIGQAIRAAGHDALLMVDAVASLGCMPFEMDAWGVDVAMSGSQKGMMTPPGLGFVAANDRARLTSARPTGTGPAARARNTIRNTPAPRPSTCSTACARRSICCSRKASPTSSTATRCWPRRCDAPSASGPKARCSASTSSSPASAPTLSPPC
jgi:alanine-glyoxylate transaminase / serine-glyoxylate transaminase / serine-pyruvate transaminase